MKMWVVGMFLAIAGLLVAGGDTLALQKEALQKEALQKEKEAKQAPPGNLFMLAKLEHAKRVLEGLTTENFELVARHAQAIGLLSHEQGWRVLQSEEYLQRSVEFRRSIDALTEAGKTKNLDGATVAYVDATLKCVECHKYIRRIRQASRGGDNSRQPQVVVR